LVGRSDGPYRVGTRRASGRGKGGEQKLHFYTARTTPLEPIYTNTYKGEGKKPKLFRFFFGAILGGGHDSRHKAGGRTSLILRFSSFAEGLFGSEPRNPARQKPQGSGSNRSQADNNWRTSANLVHHGGGGLKKSECTENDQISRPWTRLTTVNSRPENASRGIRLPVWKWRRGAGRRPPRQSGLSLGKRDRNSTSTLVLPCFERKLEGGLWWTFTEDRKSPARPLPFSMQKRVQKDNKSTRPISSWVEKGRGFWFIGRRSASDVPRIRVTGLAT